MTRQRSGPIGLLGALLALYLALPIAAFVVRLAGSSDKGFGQNGLRQAAWTSVQTATISAAIVAVFGIPLAHWMAHARGPLRRVVGVLVQLPLALPPVMSGIVLVYLVGPYTWLGEQLDGRLTESLAGIVIAQTFVAAPFLIVAARSAFEAIDPRLEDVAATLGHGPLSRFFRVDLRIAAPAIRAGLLLTWLRALGEYGATVLLAYHPYTLPVFTAVQFSSTGIPSTQAPTAIALAVAAIGLLLAGFRLPGSLRGRLHRPAPAIEPAAPNAPDPQPLGFAIDTRVGDFHLSVAHAASSPRLAVLGASGAGKSLLLRAVAGLLGPDVGTVRLGDRAIERIPVEERELGYVPQQHGLFPQRTVWQQTTFGVHATSGAAAWWLARLGLSGLADRLPDQLSGGQRQRTVLAAALAAGPRLLLLDEPFSALDHAVRTELVESMRRLQRRESLSTVLVTHDPTEAAMLADELLVILDGRIAQAGTVREVFSAPASAQVARLLGLVNVRDGRMSEGGVVDADGVPIRTDSAAGPEVEVTWGVRPEHVHLDDAGEHEVTITDVADVGRHLSIVVAWPNGLQLQTHQPIPGAKELTPSEGDAARVRIDPADVSVWPVVRETGASAPGARRG